jgi:hypothetical protein
MYIIYKGTREREQEDHKLEDKQIDRLTEEQDSIKIYPNSVADYTYVEIGFDFKEADITVYDIGGRQMQSLNQ